MFFATKLKKKQSDLKESHYCSVKIRVVGVVLLPNAVRFMYGNKTLKRIVHVHKRSKH